jgi:hypothetical protein
MTKVCNDRGTVVTVAIQLVVEINTIVEIKS